MSDKNKEPRTESQFEPHEKRVFTELSELLDKSQKLDKFIYENEKH